MINAGLRDLTRVRTKPARPILFLLDEFAALGRLDEVRRGVGLMAGYGVQFWPIVQDFSQLYSIYGASADTFIANAEVLQAFNVQDLETAKRLSDRMGDRTITFVTQTHSSGDTMSRTGPTFTSGSSVSTQAQARRLMKPEEILNLLDGDGVALREGLSANAGGENSLFRAAGIRGALRRVVNCDRSCKIDTSQCRITPARPPRAC